MEYFTMHNGITIPSAGIGTFLLKPDEAEEAVVNALREGVRLIDTANAYMNERAVGRAMKRSGIDRKEIFLVTKLWPTVYGYENAIDETLARLDTDYIDLMFLHQPAGEWKKGYAMIEEAYRAGKVKAVGLSNFPEEWLQEIIDTAQIRPHMVQVEAHPYYPQTHLKQILNPNGIGLMAWYPLGHGDRSLMEESVFGSMAEKYHKTPAQIILRWHVQMNHVVIPGSKNPVHIRDNFNIFDFALTDEEMKQIGAIDRNVRYYHSSVADAQKYAGMELDFNSQK
ncbi:MAG: aldo/keto reductase [Bulleidia sp.]